MDNVMMVDDYQFIRRYVHELDNRVGLSAIAERLELSRDELLARVERANNVLRAGENEKIVDKMRNTFELSSVVNGLRTPTARARQSRTFNPSKLLSMLARMDSGDVSVSRESIGRTVNVSKLQSMLDELT